MTHDDTPVNYRVHVGKRCMVRLQGTGRIVGINTCTVGELKGDQYPYIVLLDTQRVVACEVTHIAILS